MHKHIPIRATIPVDLHLRSPACSVRLVSLPRRAAHAMRQLSNSAPSPPTKPGHCGCGINSAGLPPQTPPPPSTDFHLQAAAAATARSPEGRGENGGREMAKVHPNSVAAVPEPAAAPPPREQEPPTVLTVWCKSLLFNCDGFTVFDAKGDLAFRVDCYTRRRAEVVLMDVAGKPLLTIRRKRLLGLAEHWLIYDGDAADKDDPNSNRRPLLCVRRHVGLRRHGSGGKAPLAHVTSCSSSRKGKEEEEASYVVEGSYGRRACAVRDANGDAVAEVRRKESVGDDVFRLVADPRLGAPLAMGLVIALDGMFVGSSGSARSLLRRTWSV